MKNKKEITKKEYILYFVIVLCVMALSIALVAVAAILQKIGVNNVVYTVIGLSSFPILILGVVFAVLKLGKMQKHALNQKVEKLEKTELICLEGASKTKIIDYCERKKYNLIENKYYHKRRFSLFNDFINYFIKLTDKNAPLDECVKKQIQLFDQENRKEKNKCLIIVLFSETVTQADLKELKEYSLPLAAAELQIKMLGLKYESLVVALLDNNSGKLYAFNDHKHSGTINSSGVNLLRKMIK